MMSQIIAWEGNNRQQNNSHTTKELYHMNLKHQQRMGLIIVWAGMLHQALRIKDEASIQEIITIIRSL